MVHDCLAMLHCQPFFLANVSASTYPSEFNCPSKDEPDISNVPISSCLFASVSCEYVYVISQTLDSGSFKITCSEGMTLFKSLQLTFGAERFFKSYLVDLGNGKLGSSRYLLYFLILYSVEQKEQILNNLKGTAV